VENEVLLRDGLGEEAGFAGGVGGWGVLQEVDGLNHLLRVKGLDLLLERGEGLAGV